MNVAVIGYGSIGARHAKILSEFNDVIVVSKRDINFPNVVPSLELLFKTNMPSYLVIANTTKDHYKTLEEIKRYGYTDKILVEKPLFESFNESTFDNSNVFVAYNLRFHPILQALHRKIKNENIISVFVYAGQYLPNWRPNTDYRNSYSAKREKGGGVLRDLSHELDYLMWLFGRWKSVTAIGGKSSDLKITSDDNYSILMKLERCLNTSLHINYVDRINQRKIIINTTKNTYIADLISNTLQINDEVTHFDVQRDDTYLLQHRAILTGNVEHNCTYDDGLEVVRLIESIEQASKTKEWINRE